MAWIRSFLVDRGGLIALAALVAYVLIAPVHIVDGDSAELVTLGSIGGVAHPTGYPAYLLWLRVTAWLPGATPAHTAAIATAILAAIQLIVLHAACRAWGARAIAATFAVAIYAAGPVALRYSSEAEVFALNQLVVAAVLYLAAREGPLRGGLRVAALGLAAGIGMADHLTCILIAPVGVLGAIRGVREARRRAAALAAGVAALVIGLTPYLYLFVTAENAVSWPGLETARDLLDHILRTAYGGPGAFGARHHAVDPLGNLAAYAITLGRAWGWLPAVAGLVMLGHRSLFTGSRRAGEPRIGWQMLALSFALAGPLLVIRFNVDLVGLGLYIVRRFCLMSTLLLALPVAAAFDALAARFDRRLRAPIAASIAVLAFATGVLVSLPDLMRVRTPAVEHAMRAQLRGLPPNAVVFASGDVNYFATGYLQLLRGERPDVRFGLWHFVNNHFYRARLVRAGVPIDIATLDRNAVPSVAVAEQILASGRPLFVDLSLGRVVLNFPTYPYGTLFRVLPRGTPLPSLDEIAALNRDWFAALDLDYPRPGRDDEYPTMIHEGYADTWRIIAQAYAGQHRDADAANATELMNQLGPQP